MDTLALGKRKRSSGISNSVLLLFTFATVFLPRLLSYFGAPSPINFGHLVTVPATLCIVLATTRTKDRRQIYIVWEMITAIFLFLAVMVVSALVNDAGLVNVTAQFLFQSEPYLFLLTIIAVSFSEASCQTFRRWVLGFGCLNLVLALAQSVLIPMGLYPRRGGTIADNTAGVFASSSGSAGNYVSSAVSVYFALYLFRFKSVPLWIRIGVLLASLYQVYISDSKQVLLALFAGWVLLVLTKTKEPVKMILYGVLILLCALLFWWALYRFEFMKPYLNWIDRPHIYGPEGVATQTKLAAFRIVPSHYHTPLNYLFGLGPGHTVTRLGGWMLKRYASLLIPLGATIHPASQEVFRVVTDGWIAQESTVFFPLFTWAGLWGDIGFGGLASYLYLASIAWRKVCVDDFGKFMMLSTGVLGFILTQMEEPGHMLTVACLLGLSWHDRRLKCDKVP